MKRLITCLAIVCLGFGVALFLQKTDVPSAAVGLPDLIVRQDTLGQQWVVREENLAANFCSVKETLPQGCAHFCGLPS